MILAEPTNAPIPTSTTQTPLPNTVSIPSSNSVDSHFPRLPDPPVCTFI